MKTISQYCRVASALIAAATIFGALDTWALEPREIFNWFDQTKNPNPAYQVNISTVEGKDTYAVDEPINFVVKVDRACYLTILDAGTSGKIHVIFPNQWHDSSWVEAGQEIRVPPLEGSFQYKVSGPTSPNNEEMVKAIATAKPLAAVENAEVAKKGKFASFKNPKQALTGIQQELDAFDQWGSMDLRFKVVDK